MKEYKARAKVERRMTRDGAVEVNKATGETVGISAREAQAALGGGGADGRLGGGGNGKAVARKPGRAASYAAHREVRKAEDGNSGTEAAHRTEQAAERGGRAVMDKRRRSKLRHPKAAAAPKDAAKAGAKATTVNAKAKAAGGKAASSPASKAAQRKAVKRGYAAAFRNGDISGAKKAAATAKSAAAKSKEAAQRTAAFVRRHWKAVGVALAIVGIFALAFAAFSSCGAMLQSGAQSVIATSYTSEDADIIQTDKDYTAKETALSNRIANIEVEYPGYDEYRYELAEIGHDPYELASYLTALYQTYTPSMVAAELTRLFGQQYKLTLTPVTEVRYREVEKTGSYTTTDPVTGEVATHTYTYTEQEAYDYHILNVKLTNRSLGAVAMEGMTAEQAEMYAVYMEVKGNKPDLFADNPYVSRGEYTDYDIPPEALTDARFAAMMREAEKYLGYPYVWGGSSPSTSFDCSGYVSWVVNHSGWDFGRLTANGLMGKCAIIPKAQAKPGDLIFFQGTYDTAGASHVGIYVGDGMMIHCGNPISYASIETPYWQSHFYCFGRLP
jgi:cell wall-associated NlpC family hydrolase